ESRQVGGPDLPVRALGRLGMGLGVRPRMLRTVVGLLLADVYVAAGRRATAEDELALLCAEVHQEIPDPKCHLPPPYSSQRWAKVWFRDRALSTSQRQHPDVPFSGGAGDVEAAVVPAEAQAQERGVGRGPEDAPRLPRPAVESADLAVLEIEEGPAVVEPDR